MKISRYLRTALSIGIIVPCTFLGSNTTAQAADTDSFSLNGSVPVPENDHNTDGEFAEGNPTYAKICAEQNVMSHRFDSAWNFGKGYAATSTGLLALDAAELQNHFLEGSGTPVDYPADSSLAQAVKLDYAFQQLDNTVQAAARSAFRGGQTYIDVSSVLKPPELGVIEQYEGWPPQPHLQIFYKTFLAMRGRQGVEVTSIRENLTSRYPTTLRYVIRDVYGFHNDDRFTFLGTEIGKEMYYLQSICGAPDWPRGAHWFYDSVSVEVPFRS